MQESLSERNNSYFNENKFHSNTGYIWFNLYHLLKSRVKRKKRGYRENIFAHSNTKCRLNWDKRERHSIDFQMKSAPENQLNWNPLSMDSQNYFKYVTVAKLRIFLFLNHKKNHLLCKTLRSIYCLPIGHSWNNYNSYYFNRKEIQITIQCSVTNWQYFTLIFFIKII